MAHRIGRKHAAETYPEPRAGGGGVNIAAMARNYASGPASDTDVPIAGVQIPWNVIDSGAALGPNVPITPHVTGRILVSAMISLENVSASPVNVRVRVQIGGVSVTIPTDPSSLLDAAPAEGRSSIVIPLSAQLTVAVGVAINIQIFVSADDEPGTLVRVVADSSTLNIQEVTFPQ